MMNNIVQSVLVSRDPEIHSGDAVFMGTRVPVGNFVDYFESGGTLEEFLDDYPSVRREQAIAALELLRQVLLAG